ncbi:MAG: lysophospholipid acyltransferase family protein [Thermoanaerobaculales bacterium]|nr:lysophospholipid acyltransferase family protein [Thermoanaerobaculales bacterium]
MSALIAINILQTCSLPLRLVAPGAFRRFNRQCADLWWGWCVTFARKFNKTKFILTGEVLPDEENAIVVVNHQQMPDIVAIMSLARSKSRLGDLKFFVKTAIKWFPGIGWGMQFIDCVFVKRNWTADRDHIRSTFSHLVDNKVPVWLVSFVEGTRSTLAKIEKGREYAKTEGMTLTKHLLPPRSKGFVATVQGLGDHVGAVYDVTIGYIDGVPNIWQFIKGSVQQVHMHARRFPIEDFPQVESDLRQWLLDRFVEKDQLLEYFYAHGVFPPEALPNEMAVVPAAVSK